MFAITHPLHGPLMVLAELRSRHMHCFITERMSDSENGSPIIVRCGEAAQRVGWALKGTEVGRIRACQVVVQIYAVHFPSLLAIDDCSGRLIVDNVSRSWTETMRRHLRLGPDRLQFAAYERPRPGCYRLSLTYTARPGPGSSPFRDAQQVFCVGTLPKNASRSDEKGRPLRTAPNRED